jgi:alkanesulfonate monooxygenase SsuD/methylene tetrahydromethanopterin reductase-like flavin-dependent oxidoreductase (luciferase family)
MQERTMRLGFTVPQFGEDAGPDALLEVARKARDLGCDSLWVAERLLYSLNPKAPYPATADGSLPLEYRRSLDRPVRQGVCRPFGGADSTRCP